MGTGSSKDTEGGSHGREGEGEGERENLDQGGGGQLYVSLKMENYKLKGDLIPHVYGSVPLIGSWDSSKALSMERESASMWELSFVVPPNHETLDFKFLLKPKYTNTPCVVEEGPNRQLIGGTLQGDARLALFKLNGDDGLEYRVFIKADRVSPFDLAASWRAYQENLRPSAVRGIPDVSIDSVPQTGAENGSSASLELDLEHYVVPAPSTCANSGLVYAANMTETPRSLTLSGVFSKSDGASSAAHSFKDGGGVSVDRPSPIREMEVVVPDPTKVYLSSGMVESKSVGTLSPLQKQDSHRGLFVDRGVGSPRLVKSSSASTFSFDLKLDTETKNSMPAASGAVAAAAIADQMLGPKEDRHLAIVLVGLPARGKTFTAAKLTRYLRWLGHDTKHFNVGKYRRLKHGANQSADFFRADNPEGIEARNEVAALAFDDMVSWMQEGGQVGVFDATNSTRKRRNMLMKMAEGKCKIIFLETICNDERIIERNIRLKIQQSPDYAEEPDFEAGLRDFKTRLTNYEKVYEPVEEGSYIKMIDMVSGHGGQIQVNNISGYLPGRIVFFLALKSSPAKFERPKYKRVRMELTITRPDDWHLHLRDGDLLKCVIPHSARQFGRAIVMPNVKPPITTTAAAVAYRESILTALPAGSDFTPLMTLYLTDTTSPNEIKLARKSGAVYGVKLYPAGATTNSQNGVTDIFGKCLPVLEQMVEQNIPLLVHGEVTDPDVDIFDREKVFIDTILQPLIQRLPLLKVVMEHITTADAVRFVESCKEGFVAATVTPQHLLLNRNSIFQGGLQPHNYCLPVLKREIHRQAIVSAVTSGSKRFFLGTDSAPHERRNKECPCGCAGIFNAPVALSAYAKVFEEAGALDKLEAFTSFNGPDFYGLPRNTSKIKLSKNPWKVPDSYSFSFGEIIPMYAGKTLEWKPSVF